MTKFQPSAPLDPRAARALDRTYEAVILDWEGAAVPGPGADAAVVRESVEALTGSGVDVAVVSSRELHELDAQLGARPAGPGQLFLCLSRGSEMFVVDRQGPDLAWRRQATPAEEAALGLATSVTLGRLRQAGLEPAIGSPALNRRIIDLVPGLPGALDATEPLARLDRDLHSDGFAGLAAAVEVARIAAAESGLPEIRVTSDVKVIELGLTDRADAVDWVLDRLAAKGVGPGLVLIVGSQFGSVDGLPGKDASMLLAKAARSLAVSVGDEPEGVPAGVLHLGGGPPALQALLRHQLERRAAGRVPDVDEDPGWTVAIANEPTELLRAAETLFTLADGQFGTRGTREEARQGTDPMVVAQGLYTEAADGLPTILLPGPLWTGLEVVLGQHPNDRRVLDLRTGVLARERRDSGGVLRTLRFSSLARPGLMGLRAEGPADRLAVGPDLTEPSPEAPGRHESSGSTATSHAAPTGGITAAASSRQREVNGLRTVERLAAYRAAYWAAAGELPLVEEAARILRQAESAGFERLLSEQRAAWAARWADAAIAIEGDPEAERAARFGLFHLMASVPDSGEAAVGARGLSGRAYAGHVFWDADVFVLPMLAATHPAAARAMLEYRVRRLPAARVEASIRGLKGARFPWESAGEGRDVTPRTVRDLEGHVIRILTGEHEEHVVADVAWAAWHYAQWSGDAGFLDGPGRALVTETARYWASRVVLDEAGHAHINGVEGPDEYHAPVDDNAFTNVMARWNLRRAAELAARDAQGVTGEEREAWLAVAASLVDGYDPGSGLYEQFAGFSRLEPLIIAEIARRPVAADVLLGPERVAGAQVVKQPDVLMLHHLVPEEVAPGSLEANLAHYGPLTAHGSSLSPAIHAALLARAGQPDRALEELYIALRLDLDDITRNTAMGLHLATMGGLWQALAHGFMGLRASAGALHVDPHLPRTWTALEVTVRFGGQRVRLRAEHERLTVRFERPLPLTVASDAAETRQPPLVRFTRSGTGWSPVGGLR